MQDKLELSELINLHSQISSKFSTIWSNAKENIKYKRADHWTTDDKDAIINQGRTPFSISAIEHKINTILATQRNARTTWSVSPKSDVADEVKAELATQLLKQKELDYEFKYIESEIFDEGISVAHGAVEILVNDLGEDSEVGLQKVPYDSIVWDINARDYLLSDALFVAKIDRLNRANFYSLYPDQKDGFIPEGNISPFGEFGGIKESYWSNQNYDIISVITHYHRVARDYYYAIFPDYNKIFSDNYVFSEKFSSKKEAEQWLKESHDVYTHLGYPTGGGEVTSKTEFVYDKYVFTYNKILSYEQTDSKDCPLIVYRSFVSINDWWTLTDLLKDPQRFLDRAMMNVDYSFGVDAKNAYELNVSALAEGETPETATQKLSHRGGVVYTRGGMGEAIKSVPSTGANPQYLQLVNISKQLLDEFIGGRAFQGLTDGANESGRAIIAKQQQGALTSSLFLDNLQRWKREVGKRLLYYIQKYETTEHIIKVHGDGLDDDVKAELMRNNLYAESKMNPGIGFLSINHKDNHLSLLKSAEFELDVAEAPLGKTDQEQWLATMLQINQFYPGLITPDMIVEYIAIPRKKKIQIVQKYQEQQQQQSQLQQMQQAVAMKNQQEQINIEKARTLNETDRNQIQREQNAKAIGQSNKQVN